MKALLDTNIITHRAMGKVINQDIGIFSRWLDRTQYAKYIHSYSIARLKKRADEKSFGSFMTKVGSYEVIDIPSPLDVRIKTISDTKDQNENDFMNSRQLNKLISGHVDTFFTEDKKNHRKVRLLCTEDNVFTIDTFIEKSGAEHADLVNYNVLKIKKTKIGTLNLRDHFFDSLREDYNGFDRWFRKKSDSECYVTINSDNGLLLSLLYLKIENEKEDYSDIIPPFPPKKRLKIGTFKVLNNGFRIGERFIRIIFDNARKNKVDEIYVTIFNKRPEHNRLISLLEQWGFYFWGRKGDERIYVRDLAQRFRLTEFKTTYPYIYAKRYCFLRSIYPEYHIESLSDSVFATESLNDLTENMPLHNCFSKTFELRDLSPLPQRGDIIFLWRTGVNYKSVFSANEIVDEFSNRFENEDLFLKFSRKCSVFPASKLRKTWNYKTFCRPFAVRFLYIDSFPRRLNMKELVGLKFSMG